LKNQVFPFLSLSLIIIGCVVEEKVGVIV
jgi:hypothetical protein